MQGGILSKSITTGIIHSTWDIVNDIQRLQGILIFQVCF